MRRGEIWWYESPGEKRRPVCVLTRDRAIPVLRKLVVVPATSRIRGIPTEVALEVEDGMPRPCALAFDDIRTVEKALLQERMTTLSPARVHQVCVALAVATGCPGPGP